MTFDIFQFAILAVALLVTGGVAGFVAGLLGVGGGIVIVPVLFYLFTALEIDPEVRMHLAVGTSLSTIIATSAMSVRAHHGKGAVDFEILRRWGPAIFTGVVLGSVLSVFLQGDDLMGVFGVVALLVSFHMAFSNPAWRLGEILPGLWWQRLMGTVIGTISTLMGIGGGTLSVPSLTLFGYPIHRAVGTAAAIGFIIGVPGTIGFILSGWRAENLPPFSLGYVSLLGLLLILPTSMLMAPYGARAAHALPVRGLKLAFAAFLFVTALRMLWNAFGPG